jgi:multicomponent Na+:H+ antiporter subunit E
MRIAGAMPIARTLALRLTLFALLWWALTEGQSGSWPLGGVFVLSATALSMALSRPVPWSPAGFVRFVPFFLWHSLRGGVDVAWRACVPSLPIAPAVLTYRFRLPPGRARVFMTAVVSLLPGTLSAEVVRHTLHIHILDGRVSSEADLVLLEAKVAALFRISHSPDHHAT